MKRVFERLAFFVFILIFFAACSEGNKKNVNTETSQKETGTYGDKITGSDTLSGNELLALLSDNDTVMATMKSTIVDNCQHTGCWMDLDLGNGKMIYVTFKDEAFTIPLDSKGKTATVEGMANKELVSVEMLKNYARDDGKSQEEIDAITQPEYTYNFVASGVSIK